VIIFLTILEGGQRSFLASGNLIGVKLPTLQVFLHDRLPIIPQNKLAQKSYNQPYIDPRHNPRNVGSLPWCGQDARIGIYAT
jgi:hypothetical protein